ncbi:hypothetical protein GCM10009858_42550 [Terrabacter carboxydivorans]|uniref:Secreted protein n=1 Tax=Terrabacter carboxydivorans TaxID=619730 RepID=A0ABP5ZLP6_9MICO
MRAVTAAASLRVSGRVVRWAAVVGSRRGTALVMTVSVPRGPAGDNRLSGTSTHGDRRAQVTVGEITRSHAETGETAD